MLKWGRLIAGAERVFEVAIATANAAAVGAEALQAAKLVLDRQKALRKTPAYSKRHDGARVAREAQHQNCRRHR